jgi:hypothetical protein
MTEKQQYAYDKILSNLPDDCREYYCDIADYAISLGYMPVLNKGETYTDFLKNKINRYILKITANPKAKKDSHWIALQFYALHEYTGIFKTALDKRISILKSMGHEPGCWGCGKCDGTWGYQFIRSDGKQGFLCGAGVLQFPWFSAENVSEVKEALKIQDDYLMKHFSK